MSDIKEIKGIVKRKESNQSTNPKAPSGHIFIEQDKEEIKLTIWNKAEFEKVKQGDSVKINYSEYINEYGGKKFTNRSVEEIEILSTQKTIEEPVEVVKITDNGPVVEFPPITEKDVVNIEDTGIKEMYMKCLKEEYECPDKEEYFVVIKGKRYRLVPTNERFVDGKFVKIV